MSGPKDEFRAELVALLPRMRRFGLSLARNRELAEDLVQSAVERALRGGATFQVGRRLDVWIFRIMRNLWIDHKRAASTRLLVSEVPDSLGDDGRAVVETRDDLRNVKASFDRLPEDQRVVLTLVVLEGFSYAEAAEALGAPIGTIMSRLSRARAVLAMDVGRPGAKARTSAKDQS